MSNYPAYYEKYRKVSTINNSGIKDWRLVIRNLPFSTTQESLLKMFSNFGPIKDITLPSLPPKKAIRFPNSCAGFAFIQYSTKNSAVNAMDKLNFTSVDGRKIAIDWALDKDSYITKVMESKSNASIDIKSEEINESDDKDSCRVQSPLAKKGKFPIEFYQRPDDMAVQEGRAIFVRNLGFDVTDADLKTEFSKFGEIVLAITCKFANSDQSTGTAFVHFKTKEAADSCLDQLNSMEGIVVSARKVYGYRAVSREEATNLKKSQEKQPKDNRHLKLLRVSLIRPGTSQANNMSAFDTEKRHKLVNVAKKKLTNLHMFVSPTRLVIHNVPAKMDDKKLRRICFLAADNADGQIKECRIMREKKDKTASGKLILGRSKGFAFIEFSDHKDALKCLQAMNNNPTMFSDEKRPIVEFSIENLQALKTKERRLKTPTAPANPQQLADIEDTKRQVNAQKPLPKKFGAKIRHRDSSKIAEKGKSKNKDGAKEKKKKVGNE